MKKIGIILTFLVLSTVALANGFDAKVSYKNTSKKFIYKDTLRFNWSDDSGIGLSMENGYHNFNSNDPNFGIRLEYDLEIMSWSDGPNVTWFDLGPVFSKKMDTGNVFGLETKFERASISGSDASEIKLIPFIKTKQQGFDIMGKLGIIIRNSDDDDGLDFLLSAKGERIEKINNFTVGGELYFRNYDGGELEHKLEGYANYKQKIESMDNLYFESENALRYVGNYYGMDISGIINLELKPRISYTQKITDDLTFITSNGLDVGLSIGSDIDDGLAFGLYLSAGVRFVY